MKTNVNCDFNCDFKTVLTRAHFYSVFIKLLSL